jgi:1-acyl-sn-glycerol-3-phosphate acyltransferase
VRELLNHVRSALSLLAVMVWFIVPGVPLLYLVLLPATWLFPRRRAGLVSWYMKIICGGILGLLRLGGARFTRSGRIPTLPPALVLMNHQSLVDILTVSMMARPHVPAFVTRDRYARFIPLVSPCIRLLGCPVVDPRDTEQAVAAIEEVARSQERAILIFPEGHRSKDGQVRLFRTAGAQAVLRARRMPVYLVVTDGFWTSRRFTDFATNVHRIRGVTEVLGPFEPPAAEDAVPAFFAELRERMVAHLQQMRGRHAGV